jgi:hypothetical protein
VPELSFSVVGARAVEHAAAPSLALVVRIESAAEVRSVLLQTQVRIDAPRREYSAQEQQGLRELFGEASQWSRSLTGILWANASAVVKPFTGSTEVELPLPVTFDFSVAAAKYFEAVEGRVPLLALFSGTVFFARDDGALQTSQLPWSNEARGVVDASLWRRTLDHYFPGRAALQVDRTVLERLRRFQVDRGLASVDHALERLLEGVR